MNAVTPVRAHAGGSQPPVAGWPYRFKSGDVLRMIEAGIIEPDARIELLDGELCEMPEEGELHVWIKNTVSHAIYDLLPKRYSVLTDSTLRLSEDSAPDPDIYVAEDVAPRSLIRPEQVRLAVEVADTSVTLDLGRKASIYARHGVRDYWVINVQREETHVFRQPADGRYRSSDVVLFDALLSALEIPELALILGELPGLKAFGA